MRFLNLSQIGEKKVIKRAIRETRTRGVKEEARGAAKTSLSRAVEKGRRKERRVATYQIIGGGEERVKFASLDAALSADG